MSAARVVPAATAENVLRVLALSSEEERSAGDVWYEAAREMASAIAPNVSMGAGVIAALSPQTSWGRNVELAVRAFTDGHASGTFGASTRAADAIMAGSDPLDILRGPKVRNFYLSIMGDPDGVCIDRHAFEVAVNVRYRDADRPSLTPGRYETVADAYRDAAESLGVLPAAVQAVTWLTWRRMHLTGTRWERHLH